MTLLGCSGKVVKAIIIGALDVIICKAANCGRIWHSGVINATIRVVEAIGCYLQRLLDTLLSSNGQLLLTADHGTIGLMADEPNGQLHAAHTTNLVPLLYIEPNQGVSLKPGRPLSNITLNFTGFLGLPQPAEMAT